MIHLLFSPRVMSEMQVCARASNIDFHVLVALVHIFFQLRAIRQGPEVIVGQTTATIY